MKPIFALIDCDNFFVSCERLFRPDLEGKPVVVLSSNDGCAISRSREAKALGIPMGAPAFKYKYFFKEQGVVQFSANFDLYGDISERITRLLTGITPRTEVYSVDESFLELTKLKIKDYTAWSRAVRARLLKEVGIPVSIGIAPTKTLAKLAREHAKNELDLGGVLSLINMPAEQQKFYMINTPINDIWGVGWRLAPKLRAEGIYNALDLAEARPRLAGQLMGVHGRQLVAELNGQSCHPLEAFGKVRQTIMKGRMFGHETNDPLVIEAAVASLTARATATLRREGLYATGIAVNLATSRHKPGYERRHYSTQLDTPSADTGFITSQLVGSLKDLIRPGQLYQRADVLLYNLIDAHSLQPDFFGNVDLQAFQTSQAKMSAVDSINSRYGKTTIRYAAEGLSEVWQPKHNFRSPRYTTNWQELPTLKPV